MSKIIMSQAQLLFVEDFLLWFPSLKTIESKSLEAKPVSSKTSLGDFFFLKSVKFGNYPHMPCIKQVCLKNHMKGSLLTALGTWVSKS